MMTNKNGQLIVYSGPSGVGKGTILAPLLAERDDLVLSVSATTRKPRDGEIDGVHYHFVSREQFEEFIKDGEMLEYAEYNGNFYGTPKRFVQKELENGKNVVLEIETKGALQIKTIFPQAVLIFVMPPSFAELENRLRLRATESQEVPTERLTTPIM